MPSTPLVALDDTGVVVSEPCDAEPRADQEWLALGPHGAVVARTRVVALERYEPHEGFVQVEPEWSIPTSAIVRSEGSFDVALFAPADLPPPPPTPAWEPDDTVRERAEEATRALASLLSADDETVEACRARDPDAWSCAMRASHFLFFRTRILDGSGRAEPHEVSMAAVGSRDFTAILAYDEAASRFVLDGLFIEPTQAGAFVPVGVIDLTGDGVPELIARQSSWADWHWLVLRRHAPNGWELLARGAPGSTA